MRYSTHWITDEDRAAVDAVLRSDWLTCGPKVQEFEEALAQYVGAKYAVAVNSGTAALYLAYMAAGKCGGPSRWRAQTSPFTFIASATTALLSRLEVVFHDVDPLTGNVVLPGWPYCISVPVHFAGRAAIIPTTGIIIEDACHALGAMDFDGCSRVGSCAHSLAACFSFHPVKPITTGEGGAVTTNDQGFAEEVRCLRDHGRRDGLMVSLGGNYRMPDILAALGLSQLKRCNETRKRRASLAWKYHKRLHWCEYAPGRRNEWAKGLPLVVPPAEPVNSARRAHHLYPVRIKGGRRDAVKAALNAQGIGAQVHYNPPVHLHPYYRERFGYKPGDFPEAEAWAAEELSLPLHAQMAEADVARVVDALMGALA